MHIKLYGRYAFFGLDVLKISQRNIDRTKLHFFIGVIWGVAAMAVHFNLICLVKLNGLVGSVGCQVHQLFNSLLISGVWSAPLPVLFKTGQPVCKKRLSIIFSIEIGLVFESLVQYHILHFLALLVCVASNKGVPQILRLIYTREMLCNWHFGAFHSLRGAHSLRCAH